jgi:hypothetical protein
MNTLVYLLLILGAIAGSLFMVFTFLANAEFGEAAGVALFFVVAGLLVAGYMVGLMFLAMIALMMLHKRMLTPNKSDAVPRSA